MHLVGRVEIMSYYTNEQKKEIYKKWIEKGRPWFNIDKSKEPSYAERQIIIEMKKQEAGIKTNNNKQYTVKDLTDALSNY